MRLLLVALCIALLGVTGWHAVSQGTVGKYFAGAPQVEQMVKDDVLARLQGVAGPEVLVHVSGRHVTLGGQVAGESARDAILAEAGQTYLLGRLTDRMEVLEIVAPFSFSAQRDADGVLSLDGYVPGREAEDALLAEARAIAGASELQSNLTVAAGAPQGDWSGIAATGIRALSAMEAGRFDLTDLDASLSGRVSGKPAADIVAGVIAQAPGGTWQTELEGAEPAPEDYIFTATKTAEGVVSLAGFAPDAATAETFVAAAAEAGNGTVEGDLEQSEDMPDAAWPDLVRDGLRALALTEAGTLALSGMNVDLTADVDTNDDLAALLPAIGAGWSNNITVLNPPPAAAVTLVMDEDGTLTASGVLPEGLTVGSFATMLPGMDVSGIDPETVGAQSDWSNAAEALNIVLPRMVTAEARIGTRDLAIKGTLRRELSEAGAVAAVETVMPDDWELDLALEESAPLAGLIFSKRGDEMVLSGVLPDGLSEQDALELLGDNASGEALASAGQGDPESWRSVIAGLASGLEPFTDATGELSGDSVNITGALKPGYTANQVQTWMSETMADGWEIGLSADETPASEGDSRENLYTGDTETFRSGYWLPDVDFAVSDTACKDEVDRAMSEQQIQFVTGSAEIDREGRALLNRLAAVAVRCLNSSVMRVEIAGHTDSVGDDATNQALSERRAEAVRAALADRGVRAEAMTAAGFGESQPIATNNTPEGRAQNRRIEFVWSAEAN